MLGFYEHSLQRLLAFIQGRKPFTPFGPGIWTYTHRGDDSLHEACLELERRNLIVKHKTENDSVLWMPVLPEPDRGALTKIVSSDGVRDIVVNRDDQPLPTRLYMSRETYVAMIGHIMPSENLFEPIPKLYGIPIRFDDSVPLAQFRLIYDQ